MTKSFSALCNVLSLYFRICQLFVVFCHICCQCDDVRACVFVCILALRDCCMMCPFPASILQWEVAAEFVHMLISSHLLMCKSNVASRIFIVSVRAGLDNPGFGKMRVCLVHMRCK